MHVSYCKSHYHKGKEGKDTEKENSSSLDSDPGGDERMDSKAEEEGLLEGQPEGGGEEGGVIMVWGGGSVRS